jgi:hypothetical protein
MVREDVCVCKDLLVLPCGNHVLYHVMTMLTSYCTQVYDMCNDTTEALLGRVRDYLSSMEVY